MLDAAACDLRADVMSLRRATEDENGLGDSPPYQGGGGGWLTCGLLQYPPPPNPSSGEEGSYFRGFVGFTATEARVLLDAFRARTGWPPLYLPSMSHIFCWTPGVWIF